jgi:hypothetical protein
MAKVTAFIEENRMADLGPSFIDPLPNSLYVLGNPFQSLENGGKFGARNVVSQV